MRTLAIVAAIAVALSGCTIQFGDLITWIQQRAVELCGFMPTIETVAELIAKRDLEPFDIVNGICANLPGTATMEASPGGGATFAGVVIDGVFVGGR